MRPGGEAFLIQQNSPTQYEELKKFVVERLVQQEDMNFEDLVEDKRRRDPGLSYDEAVDELVADACEMMLKDSKAVEQLAKENRSLAQRIADWLRKWVRSIQAAMQDLKAERPESRAMLQYAQELQKLWDDALVAAARNNRGVDTGRVQYSIRTMDGETMTVLDTENDTRSFDAAEKYLKALVNTEHPFSTILVDAQPVYIGRDLPGEYRSSEYTKSMEAKLRPVKMQAATNLDEMLLLAENGEWRENVKDKHKTDAQNGWYRYDARFAVPILNEKKAVDHYTVYGGTLLIRNDADGKSYLYDLVDIKKEKRISTASFSARGHSEVLAPKPSHTLYMQNAENSQEKSSDKVQKSLRDSTGRELTEAQKEYFKDSKVRDGDGRLLVMYHQTDGTFTVFDTKHKGAGAGDDETPFGIFLKRTSRNIGVRGEKQMELYADIRNPLRVRDRTELVSKLRELSADYARLKDESAKIDKEYGAKFEEAKNAFKNFLIQWRKNNPDAPPRAAYDADGFDAAFNEEDNVVKEWTRAKDELALRAKTSITQALRDNGYDGVILENDKGSWGRSTDAYIALNANQVKNTTNKTPTADPDIRYQQRDNLKEEYHLTDDEESAIISYKSGDSYTLNGKLTARAELTEYQRKLRDNLDAALEKLPVYRGEVYRHYNFDDFGGFEAMMEFLELFEKDEPTALGGYLSCSTVRNEDRTKGKYTANMVIQSENGRRLAGFGRNTENEILLPRNTRLVPYRMERMGPTSIRVYVKEETISDAGKTNDSALSGVRGMREGTQRSEDLRQVPGGDPGKVQSEVGRSAGRDGDRRGVPGLREGEGSASLDAPGVAENHRGLGTRGGEGENIKNQQREPKLSDRSVLSLAAEMALRQKNPGWTLEDRNRLEIFSVKLWRVRDAEAELKALRDEREVLLAGRKMAEVKGDERDADFSLYKSPRMPYNKGKRGREHGRIIYSR